MQRQAIRHTEGTIPIPVITRYHTGSMPKVEGDGLEIGYRHLYDLANQALREGQKDLAISHFLQAYLQAPEETRTTLALARLFQETGRMDSAAIYYFKTVHQLCVTGKADEAFKLLSEFKRGVPSNVRVREYLVKLASICEYRTKDLGRRKEYHRLAVIELQELIELLNFHDDPRLPRYSRMLQIMATAG